MGKKKLQPEERVEIARLHSQGHGMREIGRRVGQAGSTISAELKGFRLAPTAIAITSQ